MSDFILLTALAFCAASDVRTHRIPNYYVGYGAVMELLCICLEQVYGTGLGAGPAGLAGMGTGACMEAGPGMGAGFICILAAAVGFAARMALVWVLGFPLFVLGMAGAGDIKMAGLIAASLGIRDGLTAVMAGLILGAVLALGKMLREGSICQRFLYLTAYIRRVIQSKEIEAYYCPERDGYKCVIPLGACFFAGTLISVLWKG